MSFLRWEAAAVQQLTPTVTAASAALLPATQQETCPVFLKKDWIISQKPFCCRVVFRGCLLLCKKVVRNLLVLCAAALLPGKCPRPLMRPLQYFRFLCNYFLIKFSNPSTIRRLNHSEFIVGSFHLLFLFLSQ